jgi:hypothetical protein
LVDEPLGLAFLATLQAVDWLNSYLPYVEAYLGRPKTLKELQQAALSPSAGYNIHHIVEQTPAAKDGFGPSLIDSPENLVLIPTLTHWQITAWYSTGNERFGGLSPRDYLRGRSWEERYRIGKEALIEFGVLEP